MIEAIVIGGSSGALDAIGAILVGLPEDFAIPIALVLHLPPDAPSHLAGVLAARSPLVAKEAEDKEPILRGHLYVAPPNYHLLVERDRTFSLSADDPVHFSRPAIDVLFESAAEAFGPSLTGVLLAGASEDGALGLSRIREAGGTTAVQAPRTAQVAVMPEAALRLAPHLSLTPAAIGPFLAALGSTAR
jgi:two-component system chemotaxis response regulator CheB